MLPATNMPGLTRLDTCTDRRRERLTERLRLNLLPTIGGTNPEFLHSDVAAIGLATRKSARNRNSYYRDDISVWWVYTGDSPWFDADTGNVINQGESFGYSE